MKQILYILPVCALIILSGYLFTEKNNSLQSENNVKFQYTTIEEYDNCRFQERDFQCMFQECHKRDKTCQRNQQIYYNCRARNEACSTFSLWFPKAFGTDYLPESFYDCEAPCVPKDKDTFSQYIRNCILPCSGYISQE